MLLQVVDEPLVHREHRQLLGPGVAEQDVLLVVVPEHLGCDLVGHRREQRVALLDRHVAVPHELAEQDLDVDLVVAGVDASRVVDGVGVDPHAGLGGLDAAELGAAEVATLADDPAAQRATVDPDGVVGPVTDLSV